MRDIDLNDDMDFQRRTWKVQRMGWAFIALILLAAMLGVMGAGLLSRTTVGDAGGTTSVDYERFGRIESPMVLRVHARSSEDGRVHVWFDQEYLAHVQLERVVPEPEAGLTTSERVGFVFQAAAPSQLVTVTFHMKMLQSGRVSGHIGTAEPVSLRIQHFIYP
ncbi:MAG: hypothetical protein ACT4OO_11820 [Nitrospiraceae bacterium]